MTGSNPFSIEYSENFKRSFKKLAKVHKNKLVELVAKSLENLIDNPYPQNSRYEPFPGKLKLSEEWTFHKLELKISKGASGQIRLMYLVNAKIQTIKLVWLYSHEQFAKRPPERELKGLIQDIIN